MYDWWYIINMNFQIEETENLKKLSSDTYNYVYNKDSNVICRWGTSLSDNPTYSPFGPEFAFVDFSGDMSELRLIFEILCSTKSIAVIVMDNCTEEDETAINNMAEPYGVNVTYLPYSRADKTEGALFSLYVNKDGMCYPSQEVTENGINIFEVGNLLTDIWFSDIFKQYRWNKLQEAMKEG